jgi:ribonucleoside-diphosphate reductase alpha chain
LVHDRDQHRRLEILHGKVGTPERETGVRALVTRVAETIRNWGLAQGYFKTPEDGATFHDELVHILVRQYAAFNSPVWFNVGCDRIEPNSDARNWHWNPRTQQVEFGVTGYSNPQCSACFINSVKDSLDSILTLAKTEGMLFKWGSGTGTNLSPLRWFHRRSQRRRHGQRPAQLHERFRRLRRRHQVWRQNSPRRQDGHPQRRSSRHRRVHRVQTERRSQGSRAGRQGYDGSHPDSDAYSSIFFQNANNSVRVTDDFMYAVLRDTDFSTKKVQDGSVMKTYKAKDLLQKISEATWHCGDPGMQYDTTTNRWHTSKNTARINASNPCSEYMFLDDSACNLASLNLLKFAPNGTFDVEAYRHAVDVLITAQEILVDNAGYPTEMIMRNSHDYRPLGFGYANLGALLMAAGLPYDSDAGRDYAACVTAIMCGEAYLQSSRIAEQCAPLTPATETVSTRLGMTHVGTDAFVRPASEASASAQTMPGGACPGWYINREPFLDVIRMHRASVNNINKNNVPTVLYESRKPAGTKPSPTAKNTAIATPKSQSSPPPAPSAS